MGRSCVHNPQQSAGEVGAEFDQSAMVASDQRDRPGVNFTSGDFANRRTGR